MAAETPVGCAQGMTGQHCSLAVSACSGEQVWHIAHKLSLREGGTGGLLHPFLFHTERVLQCSFPCSPLSSGWTVMDLRAMA
jgi:hypothetical protein